MRKQKYLTIDKPYRSICMREMETNRLLTRSEVIDLWNKQDKELLSCFACPSCRDILEELSNNTYCCNNEHCDYSEIVLSKPWSEANK